MAKRATFLLLAAFFAGAAKAAPPAQTSLTVDQLDHLLVSLHGSSDKSAARQLAGLKLTERVSLPQLSRWEAGTQGTGSLEALLALADAAAFLPPPASEISHEAAPDAATQQQILERAIDYVERTLPKLPNFLAQRTTTGFAVTTRTQLDMSQDLAHLLVERPAKQASYHALGPAKASGLPDAQLFWTGSTTEVVSYRGGHEESEPSAEGAGHSGKAPFTLTSEGEFGPILAVILRDAPQDEVLWDHWERGLPGMEPDASLAVFHFAVPRDRSHYAVMLATDESPDFPAYQGQIAVDPSNGTIYRIAVNADARDSSWIHEASIMVEYGPAEIGGMNYILPIHAVAMAKTFNLFVDLDAQPPPVSFLTSINDIAFTGYHVFRAKSRIVSGAGGP